LNPLDYEFLEDNPNYGLPPDPDDFLPQRIVNSFSDLKDLGDSFLSDARCLPLIKEQYLEYVSNDSYSILHNPIEDKYIYPLSPKRGNKAYAYKQRKKYKPLIDAFSERSFSSAVGNRKTMHCTSALLITFTYDRKQWTVTDAWRSITPVVNQFKAYLTKELGITYGSFLSKEGTKDGYPAPHLILLLDNTVPAFKHNGKWRVQSFELVTKLKDAWARYSRGSYCDIQAIIDGKIGKRNALGYILKYATKTVSLDPDKPDDTAIYTNAFQKLFNLRNIVSKDFKKRIDCKPTHTRLDIISNELKLLNKQRDKLINEIREHSPYDPFALALSGHSEQLYGLNKTIERLEQDRLRFKMEDSPWFYISGGFTSLEQAKITLSL